MASSNDSTANEALLAALIRHQVGLLRFSIFVQNRVIALLNRSEQDMADKIRSRLADSSGLTTTADLRRYESLMKSLDTIRSKAFVQAQDEWVQQMQDLSVSEAAFINSAILNVSPVVIQSVLPSAALLKKIATSRPFQGRIMRDWAMTLASDDRARIANQIQAGMVAGESSQAIARRIVGTAMLDGGDGVTEITRRQSQAITRTAINAIATNARNEYYSENTDLFDMEQFHATLDSRTTLLCASLDGKQFPVGKGPMPPLHYGCRSLRIPVLDGNVLSNRPAKNITDKQVLREYNDANGLSASSRDDLPRGHKGSFDDFRRSRVREMTGTVPGTTTYEEFLRGQSASFQDDVLGATKGKLFRDGGLSLDRFVSRSGSELTLPQLAQRDADAFKAAGLDPESFQ